MSHFCVCASFVCVSWDNFRIFTPKIQHPIYFCWFWFFQFADELLIFVLSIAIAFCKFLCVLFQTHLSLRTTAVRQLSFVKESHCKSIRKAAPLRLVIRCSCPILPRTHPPSRTPPALEEN